MKPRAASAADAEERLAWARAGEVAAGARAALGAARDVKVGRVGPPRGAAPRAPLAGLRRAAPVLGMLGPTPSEADSMDAAEARAAVAPTAAEAAAAAARGRARVPRGGRSRARRGYTNYIIYQFQLS